MLKIEAFIDGVALHSVTRTYGFQVDFKRLSEWLRKQGGVLVRKHFYTLLDETAEFSSLRPLVDWLDYNGYDVVTKRPKFRDDNRQKGSILPELFADAFSLTHHPSNYHVFLFLGDSDYLPLVTLLKRHGIVVTVVSGYAVKPAHVADELRRAADNFVDIGTLIPHIERQERRERT